MNKEEEEEIVESGLLAHSIIYFSIATLTRVCTDIVLEEEKAMMKAGLYITVKEP